MKHADVCPVLQLVSMDSENDGLMKEYTKMMTDMIVLCATLALSLFFWVLSLTISTYYGEPPCLGNFLSRVWGMLKEQSLSPHPHADRKSVKMKAFSS